MTGNELRHVITKLIAPVARRTRTIIARGVLELIDDGKKIQAAQVSTRADNLHDDVERFQPHGFTSVPAIGAECIVVHVGGNSDHPVVIAVDDRRYRPKNLAEGEACVWTIANGKRVHCKADGTIILGTDASEFVALANLCANNFTKISAALTAICKILGPASGSSGTPVMTVDKDLLIAPPTSPETFGSPYTPVSVAATEVKAK